jgi:hypothetical protein
MKTTAILTATLGLMLGSLHAQTVPPFINYQGRVTDSGGVGLGTGTPVNRKVIFRIFDAPTAGTRLWSEQHTVTISNGEFSVLLGNGINANYAGADETPLKTSTPLDTVFTSGGILRYVEIVVDNGDNTLNTLDAPISPRQQITSTAYSFRARSADTIASGTDLQLNGSANYGLGYYGSTRLFNGAAVDGPVLFGQAGGALGSVNGGTKNIALRWNSSGNVGIGSTDLSGAAATTKLVLQGDDSNTAPQQLNIRGNSDTNKRLLLGYNTTNNYGSLQAYSTASTTSKLLLNPSGGNVGIGTNNPTSGAALEVNGSISASSLNLPTTSNSNAGLINSNGSRFIHAYGTNSFFAGQDAGNFTLTGSDNVGVGFEVLQSLTTGKLNVALGSYALNLNTSGSDNTAVGASSLSRNTTGIRNTAVGRFSLTQNTTGVDNTSIGMNALSGNTTGPRNTAVGYTSLRAGTTAGDNTAVGYRALTTTTNGDYNTAVGSRSLESNTTGIGNVAIGHEAGGLLTTGFLNIAIGYQAGGDLTTGSTNNIAIGNRGSATSNKIWLGTEGTHAQTILAGNVGIGTETPTKAKLEVNGAAGNHSLTSSFREYTKTSPGGLGFFPNTTGINSFYASGRLTGQDFIAFSDVRIKHVEGRSDPARDLVALQGIEVTDYTYIDTVTKGSGKYKKVIAQQVEKVYPQAVSRSTDEVPDIYKKATIKDGWVMLATDLKKGERVRLIGDKNEGIHEVLEVEKDKFRTAFTTAEKEIFVYGREVKDFRSVDYEAISMLNVSATQELARKLDAKNGQIAELQERLAALEAKDQDRDAKLTAIEAMLRSPEKSGAVNVSLKQEAGAE